MTKRIRFDCIVIVAGMLLITVAQHRKSVHGETRIKLPSDISFTHESSDNIEGEVCYNRNKRMNGICTLPNECPEAIADFKKGIQPQICNYKGQLPIICCPRHTQTVASSTTSKATSTTTTAKITTRKVVRPLTTPHAALPSTTSATTQTKKTSNAQATQNPIFSTTPKASSTTKKPTISNGPRISEVKCREYVKLTIEESVVTTLSLTPDNQVVQTNKCLKAGSEGFIVGGTKTEPGEFPHMAAIGWKQDDSDEISWNCGGSLISYRFVLSAAHCTSFQGIKANVIRLGEQNLKRTDDKSEPQDFGIEQIIRHPEYRGSSKYNDIALFKLNRNIKITDFVKPACLWQSFDTNYTSAIAIGFGFTTDRGQSSDDLLKVSLHLINNERCNGFFQKFQAIKDGIIDTQLCAGDDVEEKDTCNGDSGGPLQVTASSSACSYHVLGVTSFGKACGTGYGVYTRVSQYLDWIESIVWSG